MYNSTRHSVLKVITIGWSHLQSSSNKPLKIVLSSKLIFWKATKVGSHPKFPKLISQLRGIPQPQYFVPSLLEPHWTYLWKHYIYHKKDTKVGIQILATKFGFVPDCSSYYRTSSKLCTAVLLWGESTSEWWIPLTKGQQCGKHFQRHENIVIVHL